MCTYSCKIKMRLILPSNTIISNLEFLCRRHVKSCNGLYSPVEFTDALRISIRQPATVNIAMNTSSCSLNPLQLDKMLHNVYVERITIGECNTILSVYTVYRHLE